MKATTWSDRRATDIGTSDIQKAWPMLKWTRQWRCFRLAVDEQAVDRIELVAEVDARRADRRQVAQAGADGVAQIADVERARRRPRRCRSRRSRRAPSLAEQRLCALRTIPRASRARRSAGRSRSSGLTSKRPQPRMLVAPPRKYRLKNGTFGSTSPSGVDGTEVEAIGHRRTPADAR